MKKDLWTSHQQIQLQSFINPCAMGMQMVQLPGRMISHFLINYVCVFHTTQRLHSQRNESMCSHEYLCTNVSSTCIQKFSTLLSKWSFPFCNSNRCLYSRQKEGEGVRRGGWSARSAVHSLLHRFLWLNL